MRRSRGARLSDRPVAGRNGITEVATNYLTTRQAAAWLGLSHRTLDRYRLRGGGPDFHRFGGCIRYFPGDLKRWAEERRMKSTSEVAAPIAGRPRAHENGSATQQAP
ncbi:MAG: helix-turn-helix domain-containing protein [Chloroflexi bacterium]|nr:helix-turn-helix domain-containing protein [Chloroflexota bacterium]